ncbi:MAG TPA: SDR family NAD(P)-dependent oxidoreductase [Dehalococcoidia bacterium]|jgi:NAD(P)-dependent dehydrogenase (short-subunit alcohol dehydrogenase family)|nr:SDR family NAD(P)-dependent oxidoreductase [Dehalococcoidia bacterium]
MTNEATDPFRDRVAVITGAASGIGAGIARMLVEAGSSVVLADIDEPALETVATELRATEGRVAVCRTDVSQASELERLAATTIETFGEVHLLVNNAGVMTRATLAESSAEDWQWIFNVNLHGMIEGVRAFLPHLRDAAPSHIVNTGSMSGLAPRADANLGVYSASKGAVVVYSELLRAELAAEGIGVSVLCPGPVSTQIWGAERGRPEHLGEGHDMEEPGRAGSGMAADEVGRIVLDGVRANEGFIFTHEDSRSRIDQRMERIGGSLDWFAAR